MTRYILISLLQLLSGVSIPLYTVHYGKLKVPFVLHYQMEPDSSQMAVAQCWTLQIGEDACLEDDAGNHIQLSSTGFSWPRGTVQYSLAVDHVKGFTVLDADSVTVCRVDFWVDNELRCVSISGRNGTELQQLTMDYSAPGILHSISRSGSGSVEFDFVTYAGRKLKSLVCRKDVEGRVTGLSEYVYHHDSLCESVIETVSDGQAVTRKTVRSFTEGQIVKKEEYTGAERLKRSTTYRYTDDEEIRLESMEIVTYPDDSLAPPETSTIGYKYAAGQPCPVEVVKSRTNGDSERLVYIYRGMTDVINSLSRWRNGVFVDTTSVIYDEFLAVDAPSGHVLRPSAIVYSNADTQQDTCLEYTAYDSLGLRASRAKALNRHTTHNLPLELFRWTGPDPIDDLMRELRSYEVCAAWPDIVPDPECGTNFLFEGTGAYLGKVEAGELSHRLIADRGFGEEPLSASFSDPNLTPSLIDRNTSVELVTPAAVEAHLNKAGAFDESHHGLFCGMWFLWRESQFGCRLDFASRPEYDIFPQILYVTEVGPMGTVAHDNYNFGNYLWGATACEVGVPQWMALLGSHLHAFFSPFSFGKFDSPDDIFSIRSGYHWDE